MNQRPTAYDWDKKLGKQQLSEEETHKIEKLQDNFFNCFSTDAGKKVMQHFEDTFLNKPVAISELGINGIPLTYMREGENNLIRYIKRLIKQSETRRK